MELTKDSEKLICVMYKSYLENRKLGFTKSDANNFGSTHNIHNDLFPDWLFDDVVDTCRELNRSGFIDCLWGDNIAYCVKISDSGIVYMENRFKKGLSEIIDFVTKFI